MNTLSELISSIGTRKVAKAAGVTDAAVCKWKTMNSLPVRPGALQKRADRYQKIIADLAGISVDEVKKYKTGIN